MGFVLMSAALMGVVIVLSVLGEVVVSSVLMTVVLVVFVELSVVL